MDFVQTQTVTSQVAVRCMDLWELQAQVLMLVTPGGGGKAGLDAAGHMGNHLIISLVSLCRGDFIDISPSQTRNSHILFLYHLILSSGPV